MNFSLLMTNRETVDTRSGNVLLPDGSSIAQVLTVLTDSASLLRQIIDYCVLSFG